MFTLFGSYLEFASVLAVVLLSTGMYYKFFHSRFSGGKWTIQRNPNWVAINAKSGLVAMLCHDDEIGIKSPSSYNIISSSKSSGRGKYAVWRYMDGANVSEELNDELWSLALMFQEDINLAERKRLSEDFLNKIGTSGAISLADEEPKPNKDLNKIKVNN